MITNGAGQQGAAVLLPSQGPAARISTPGARGLIVEVIVSGVSPMPDPAIGSSVSACCWPVNGPAAAGALMRLGCRSCGEGCAMQGILHPYLNITNASLIANPICDTLLTVYSTNVLLRERYLLASDFIILAHFLTGCHQLRPIACSGKTRRIGTAGPLEISARQSGS